MNESQLEVAIKSYQFKWPQWWERKKKKNTTTTFSSNVVLWCWVSCVFSHNACLWFRRNHSSKSLVRYCIPIGAQHIITCFFISLSFVQLILFFSSIGESHTLRDLKPNNSNNKNTSSGKIQFQGYGFSVLFSLTSFSHAI